MHMNAQSAMQDVENGDTPVRQRDSDEDSLFGSPPASPVLRGRSPSPGLALPSADNATKNVGTIALPRSQCHSEFPVNPLALSLSHAASTQPAPRPPANAMRLDACSMSPSRSASPVSSRASSTAPRPKAKKQQQKKKKTANTKKNQPSPQPTAPEIPLPDPSEPVPANFLRSQMALLGTAGLVAGIKPRNLATNLHTRGTKASLPIVIQDDARSRETQKLVEHPTISRKPAGAVRQSVSKVDPSLLPLPTNQEVVALLARQRDFFITLESILKLVASGAGAPPPPPPQQQTVFRSSVPAFRQTQPTQALFSGRPPAKKRRLDRVPAGAVDWDVPFPFAQGEGPAEYRENWGRERLKQLISQLTSMIKDATRKIAIRKFIKEQATKKMAAQRNACASSSTNTTQENVQTCDTVSSTSASNPISSDTVLAECTVDMSQAPAQLSNSDAPNASSPTSAFDQLISSLVSATPGNTLDSLTSSPGSIPSVPSLSSFDLYASAASPAPLSSADFDNWLNILQTFPPNGLDPNQIPNTPVSTEEDFGFIDSILDFDSGAYSQSAVAESSLEQLLAQAGATSQSGSDDMIIDPALLAISGAQAPIVQTPFAYSAASPIPSTVSSGTVESMDPATPNSAAWETSLPEIYTTGDGQQGEQHSSLRSRSGLLAQDDINDPDENANREDALFKADQEKGKGKEIQVDNPPARMIVPPSNTPQPATLPPSFTTTQSAFRTSSSSNAGPLTTNTKALNKADILRRAKERIKQLDDEIIKAKTQLWETTIEGSILVHMNREYNNASNSTR